MEELVLFAEERDYPKDDVSSFKRASKFSEKYLKGKKRLNGESWFEGL